MIINRNYLKIFAYEISSMGGGSREKSGFIVKNYIWISLREINLKHWLG
jgi:hypothetical protein